VPKFHGHEKKVKLKMKMNKKIMTGLFMLAFLAGAIPVAALGMNQVNGQAGEFRIDPFLKGEWALAYERAFNKHVAIYQPAINAWGILNYALFKEGSEGVLVGRDGWLFTREEFDYYPDATAQINEKVDYISQVRDTLAQRDIDLVIVPVPAKSRLYSDKLGRYRFPAYKQDVYASFVRSLKERNIPVADTLLRMKSSTAQDPLFLKGDTHWTPAGAWIAANAVAGEVTSDYPDLKYPKTEFVTKKTGTTSHEGDLTRYVPLGPAASWFGMTPDQIAVYETEQKTGSATLQEASLFSDEKIPVVLVGTSYSANPAWNFEGFLKQALGANVLNAADEGMGPFETMKKYLKDDSLATNPPQLVVWEIPERYLPVKYDLGAVPSDLNI
jgi:alginate O-acetyltransferase complex protein AlgJ